MSVSAIFSSNLFQYENQKTQNNNIQQFKQEFQQLGEDLQSGNLTAAQSDFAALEQVGPNSNSTASGPASSPLANAFQQLSKDLQSGNLSAAQQDYTTMQHDIQDHAAQMHPHHHHRGAGAEASQVTPLFEELGQDLQSGNLSSAQSAYARLQQDLPQLAAAPSSSSGSSASNSSISVSA
jgi:outer membrane protein assembly factor BamD (BamD/ComL family)